MLGYPGSWRGSTVKKKRRDSTWMSSMTRSTCWRVRSPTVKTLSLETFPFCWATMLVKRMGPSWPEAWTP